MGSTRLRQMETNDRAEVAELICVSLNYWYQLHGMGPIFAEGPSTADAFFDVYETLEPGCGLVVENEQTGRLMGSCFFHPRSHHVSLGIMNVHPNYFGRGVAKALLAEIIEYTESRGFHALRLIQSASLTLQSRILAAVLTMPDPGESGYDRGQVGAPPSCLLAMEKYK